MKKNFLLSFLVLGLSSLISQVTILRELMVSFYGNEFFIGIVLAIWVLWVALGSFLTGWLKLKNNLNLFYILTFILVPLFFALEIILIRYLNNFSVVSGQLANLAPAMLGTLFLPAPLCFILGSQFASAAKIFSKENFPAETVSQIYLWESLGFVLGGVLFNFWLVHFNPFFVLISLALANLVVAFGLSQFLTPKKFWLKIVLLILIISASGLIFAAKKIDEKTLAWRFGNQKLIESFNSPYGNLAVTKIGSQYNFYESGLLLGPDKEIQNNEYLAHLVLLQYPQPKNILLIGNGFNGLINEILKHPIERLTYLELDNQLLDLVKKYVPEDIRYGLNDKRVEILNLDGRYFIKNSSEKFDVILINLPTPATALINRFYTQEFFREAAKKLNPSGILASQLPFSPEYQNSQLTQLNDSLFKTLSTVFSQVLILPEETNLFLTSQGQTLTDDPNILISRLKERQIKTAFLTENYLRYRLTNERIGSTLNSFSQDKITQINQDFKPLAYLYNLTYWLTYFYPNLTTILTKILKINYWWLLTGLLLIVFLSQLASKRKRPESVFILNMSIFGFLIMTGEIVFILLYQTIFGYLYYQIALLIGLLMAGLALGTWQGKKQTQTKNITNFSVIKIQLILILFMVFSFFFVVHLQSESQILSEIIFYAIIFIFGYLAGFGFPYLNYLYLKNKKDLKINLSLLYAADLLGAALGAILPALVFLPLFGLNQTLFLMMAIIGSGALLLFFAKNLSSKNV